MKRDRPILGEIGDQQAKDTPNRRRKKARKSLGRRVSFAPDSQLETMHLFQKDAFVHSPIEPQLNRSWASADLQSAAGAGSSSGPYLNNFRLDPLAEPASPAGSQFPAGLQQQRSEGNLTAELASPGGALAGRGLGMGDITLNITAGVPGLGTLLEEDEADLQSASHSRENNNTNDTISVGMELTIASGRILDAAYQPEEAAAPAGPFGRPSKAFSLPNATSPSQAPTHHNDTDDLSLGYSNVLHDGVHPVWGAAADATAHVGQGEGDVGPPDNQVNKWGFVPGEDDTMELNLEHKGRLMMGEVTYNHIYGSSTDTTGRALAAGRMEMQMAGQDDTTGNLSERLRCQDATLDGLRDAMEHNLQSPQQLCEPVGQDAAPADEDATGDLLQDEDQGELQQQDLSVPLQDAESRDGGAADASPEAPRDDTLAFLKSTGKDMTTRLLLEDDVTDAGPMGNVRRRLHELKGMQSVDMGGYGRSDSSGPHTLALLQTTGRTTQLLARTNAAAASWQAADDSTIKPTNGTTRLLADYTMASVIGKASTLLATVQPANPSGLSQGQPSAAQDLDDLDAPPELPAGWTSAVAPAAATPAPTANLTANLTALLAIPGGPLLQRTPPQASSIHALQQPNGATATSVTAPKAQPADTTAIQAGPASPEAAVAHNPAGFALGRSPAPRRSVPRSVAKPAASEDQAAEPESMMYSAVKMARTPIGPKSVPRTAAAQRSAVPAAAEVKQPFIGFSAVKPGRTPVSLAKSVSRTAAKTPAEPAAEAEVMYSALKMARTPIGSKCAPRSARAAAPEQAIFGGLKLARTPVGQVPAVVLQSATVAAPDEVQMENAGLDLASARPDVMPGGLQLMQSPVGLTASPLPTYPLAVAAAAGAIPGGHKLARTPVGGVPAVVAAAQAATSAPSPAPAQELAPITFQDFLKEIDMQFHDHMRRGTSINFADLAQDPPPANLQESYALMAIIAPEVAEYEAGIATLQAEIQQRKTSVARKESALAENNPAIFQAVQLAGGAEVDHIKRSVALLKKVCRQRTLVAWKEWRASMEAHRGTSLQTHLQLLQHDSAFLESNLDQLRQVAKKVDQFVAGSRTELTAQLTRHRDAVTQRERVKAMRTSVADLQQANTGRWQRMQASEQRLATLKAKHATLGAAREELSARLDRLSEAEGRDVTVSPGSWARKLALSNASAGSVLNKVEDLDILMGCQGWRLEGAAEGRSAGELVLRFGDLFRLRLLTSGEASSRTTQGLLELTRPEEAAYVPADRRGLAACLAGASKAGGSSLQQWQLTNAAPAQVTGAVQQLSVRLGRINDLLAELDGLRLAFPRLSTVTCAGPAIQLALLNLDAEVHFVVTLDCGADFPAGMTACDAKVCFCGASRITAAEVIAAANSVGFGPPFGHHFGTRTVLDSLGSDA
ncbi:hypothetical protein WJX72_001123 [[Myrmecia] bisecta]|uniref:Spc7 kinetochore protein domain-containing protein n=1 Tax=[Myrmecia] bisecta TaxID=41462 RepID=A0AAW1PWH3_9CHLO